MKLTWTIIPVLAGYFLACGPAEQPAPAQPPALSAADSLQRCAEADALLARADTASREKDSLLLRAAGLYQASRAAEAWVKTQRALFNFYRKNDDYDAAFEQLDAAVRAIWWPEDASTGQLHTLLGFTLRRLGRNYAASIHYEQARQISDRVGGVTRTNPAGPIYKTLANIKTRLGENEEAIKLLQAGLDLLARDTAAERRLDNRITQAEIYDDLGIAFQNDNQPERALEQYAAGLAVLAGLGPVPEDKREWAASVRGLLLSNQAGALLTTGAVAEADRAVQAALAALPASKSNYRFSALNIRAAIAAETGNRAAAQQYRQVALELAADPSVERREAAKLLNEMGWSAYQAGQFDTALAYAQQALHLIYPAVSAKDIHDNPRLDLIGPDPENTTAEALDLKGEALWQRSRTDQTGALLPLANRTTALAIDMMENLRDVAVYESSKLNTAQQSRRLFNRMMRLLYAGQKSGGKSAAREAFVLVEKSKAVLLQQKIAADAAQRAAGVADSLIRQGRDLSEQRAYLRNRLFDLQTGTAAPDSAELANVKRRLFQVEQAQRQLSGRIAQRYALTDRSGDRYLARVEDVREKLLRKNEVWLEYFTDTDSNLVYLIAVDAAGQRFECLPYREAEVRQFIDLFNSALVAENRSGDPALFVEFSQTAHRLYRQLIEPGLGGKTPDRITLAPDGALALLPFDVLLRAPAPNTGKADYHSLPFLIKTCPTRLAASATLDLFYANQPQRSHRGSYAGFAPDYSGSVLGQVEAGAEVVQSAAASFQGNAFVGQGASVDSFLSAAPGQAIIHFHGHAEASDSFPDYSWMAFTSGPVMASASGSPETFAATLGAGPRRLPDQERAHCLFAHQIYQSQLNADLVVLSACQTGLGKIAPGEGTLSLARAFHGAGCPATVMSLWKVRDDATAALIRLFLENIRQGMDKDEALAQAKRSYLASAGGEAFPYFWAGFVLTGNAGPVELPGPWWSDFWLWAVLAAMVMGVAGYWLRSRRA